MRKKATLILLLCCGALTVACTSTKGLIEVRSRPRGATVFLDDIEQGMTPVRFEYDFKAPATLKISKNGYYEEKEFLNESWVEREIRKGNYSKGKCEIGGEYIRSWMITTFRKLEEEEK